MTSALAREDVRKRVSYVVLTDPGKIPSAGFSAGKNMSKKTTTAPDATHTPTPAIAAVHGGPFVRGVHWEWEWEREAQFLASRGYVVLEPEFRGSTGFGGWHFKSGWKQWGLAMQAILPTARNGPSPVASPTRTAFVSRARLEKFLDRNIGKQ